jgi:hypothetical protein
MPGHTIVCDRACILEMHSSKCLKPILFKHAVMLVWGFLLELLGVLARQAAAVLEVCGCRQLSTAMNKQLHLRL